jgi:hypothetical protein
LGNDERLYEFEIIYAEGSDPNGEYRVPQVNPRFRLKFTNYRMDAF